MKEHAHPSDEGSDEWSRQHTQKGERREPELAPAKQALLEAIHLQPGFRVLDVACGAGDTTAAAAAAGAVAMGIDTSRAMIRIARQRFPGLCFEEGDMALPSAGPWDGIVCRLGAHHAPSTWITAAYRELKPGGRLAIAERDATDAESRANGMKSLDEWMELLKAAGFQDVTAKPTAADLGGRIHTVSGRRPGA